MVKAISGPLPPPLVTFGGCFFCDLKGDYSLPGHSAFAGDPLLPGPGGPESKLGSQTQPEGYEYGSKFKHQGTAGFSAWFHLLGFQNGYSFLTRSRMILVVTLQVGFVLPSKRHPFPSHLVLGTQQPGAAEIWAGAERRCAAVRQAV